MPPKVTKKSAIVETVSNVKTKEMLTNEWIDIVKTIAALKDQLGPLETKRDNVTSELLKLMDKTPDVEDMSSIIETNTIPVENILPIETPVKGKGKKEVEPVVKKTPVKKTTKKTIEPVIEVETVVIKPKGKNTKSVDESETKTKVTKTPAKSTTKAPVTKGKSKLEEDSETEVKPKSGYVSSSDTDLESLSSCSSNSDDSEGEED